MLVVETAVGQAVVAYARRQGLSLEDVATQLGLPLGEMNDLLHGERLVDASLGSRLATVVGGSGADWVHLGDRSPRVARWLAALDQFGTASLKALRDRGYVSATKKQPGKLADELDAFFDCEPDECSQLVPASFRQSLSFNVHEDAVQVWLHLASMQASFVAELDCVPELDLEELKRVLPGLVRVGEEVPSEYLERVRNALTDAGVVVVFQPDVPGTRLSGASWPTPDGPAVVALTLRHAFDDFFWWTVYHECSHLLLGHGLVVDTPLSEDVEGKVEDDADDLARSMLLPLHWDATLGTPSKDRVREAAAQFALPAGVLVGQLQRRKSVEAKDMNGLKKSMPDPASLEVRPGVPSVSGPEWDASVADLLRDADAS